MRSKSKFAKFFQQWDLQIMVWPALLLVIIFSYLPMYGLVMAFQDYDLFKGFSHSPWVGWKHFEAWFNDPRISMILRNTLSISALKLIIGFPMPIILAILINEVRHERFKRSVQTITYLPHFLSWVIVAGIVKSFLAADNGTLNEALQGLGLVDKPINYLARPNLFWPIVVIVNVWKSAGYNSIVYLAAITGIDAALYEAAEIDGASKLQQIVYITFPGILPIVTIFLILNIGQLLSAGFEDLLLLGSNPVLTRVATVLDTYVYSTGVQNFRYSYATAVGLFKAVISIGLLSFANWWARRTETSLW